ncbi:MAG: hypothetical protein ACK52U_16915 [Synechococcaceae cyanobacterium]
MFTSREALPAPFTASLPRLELHRLEKGDAVALIERSLAEETGLNYTEATEAVPLLEILQGCKASAYG